MAITNKDLGIATAHGEYLSKGGTKTEDEFAQMFIDFEQAVIEAGENAEAAEQSATRASQSATAAASSASLAAESAGTAHTDAQTAANAAAGVRSDADRASAAATESEEIRDLINSKVSTATQAASTASAAAGNAASSASEAQTAAQTATSKAAEAVTSADTASRAKDDAVSAKTAAQTAAQQAGSSETSASANASAAAGSAQTASTAAQTATTKAGEASDSASAASGSASTASTKATEATTAATLAQSYAKGDTSSRAGEATDNAKYYKEQAEAAKTAAETAAASITVDTTLTQSGKAADAKATGDEISELKNDLTGSVSIDGTDEVTPKNLQILDKVISPNLIDTSKITDGKYITADGVEHNGNYFVTDYIPVEAGAEYCGTVLFTNATTGGTILYPLAIRWLACYDSDKNVIASAGSNTQIATYPYTIPDGVSYVRLSMTNNASYSQHQFEKGTESTTYYPYGELISAEIKREYIPQEDVDMADIPAFHLVEGQNLINKDDADYVVGKYITRGGQLHDSAAFVTTGFIAVTPGDTLLGSYLNSNGVTALAAIAYIAAYDSNKTAVVNSGVSGGSSTFYTVPDGIYYVRCSIRVASYTSDIQITRTDSGLPKPYKPYEAPHYEILDSYTPQGEPPLHVYLPSDIYVAVGRTIELYNEQVCIDHEKYHFRWVCTEGSAYARKFSITGTATRNLNLDLYLYNDKKKICWCGRCVIHVVAASNPTKKILPIGDSLTNWKAWLQETMLLSENHISWLGTRYSGQSVDSEGNVYASGTIHHEGRSGWSASDYLANSEYTFDNRYDGVSSVSGSANPFWNGSAFSLNHYLTTQTGVDTPDAVQILLGTNDIRDGIEPATANIVAMVQTIRTEYPDIPIFVCNTIYNANQNGYGSVGSDAYAASVGASAWQYDQDCLVMDLMISLKKALASITGIYIIPLATCMDREYDFGQAMTKVNPRSDVEIPMPVERIHPQAVGYYQMADLMYSFYCGVLN